MQKNINSNGNQDQRVREAINSGKHTDTEDKIMLQNEIGFAYATLAFRSPI
jgi:hypothetical protein